MTFSSSLCTFVLLLVLLAVLAQPVRMVAEGFRSFAQAHLTIPEAK